MRKGVDSRRRGKEQNDVATAPRKKFDCILSRVHASQAYVERIFSVCGLLHSGRCSVMFRSPQMRVCLKLSQRVLKETSCPQ